MARTYRIEIVTPDRVVYAGEVESLRVTAYEGELGVLAGHAPMLCVLRPGAALLRTGSERKAFAVGGGFMEVSGGKVLLLVDSAETPESIDRKRAEEAVSRARERLHQVGKDVDLERAEKALARALNRLQLAEKYGGGRYDF
jgi:F-type H+-transporting ATPase subunit epsilon